MPTLATRTRLLILGGGVAALLLGALAARGASSTLVSPMPAIIVTPGILAWLAVGGALVVLLGGQELPRLVRRLLVIGILAVSGWSIGTIARGVYVTLAFALDGAVEEDATAWRVVGNFSGSSAGQSLVAFSLELRRNVSLPFDGAAAEAIARQPGACITLPLERTASGVTRVRVPDEPLGVDDLEACPAVQRIGG